MSGEGEVLRVLAEVGPQARWVLAVVAGVVVIRTLYLGIAMIAAITTDDEKKREVRYRVFRDLLEALFPRRGRR